MQGARLKRSVLSNITVLKCFPLSYQQFSVALFIQHGASCQSLPTLSPYTHSYKVQVIVGSSLSVSSYFFSFISIKPFCFSPYTHSYKVQVSKSQAELSVLSTIPQRHNSSSLLNHLHCRFPLGKIFQGLVTSSITEVTLFQKTVY